MTPAAGFRRGTRPAAAGREVSGVTAGPLFGGVQIAGRGNRLGPKLLNAHVNSAHPRTEGSPMTTSSTALAALSAGTWTGDVVHHDITIRVRHMAVGKVKGTFALTSAELVVPESGITGASVTAVIDAASVNTKNADRDAHVRSGDFLDTETYPTITFTSTGVEDFDGENFKLVGDLTLHGVTKSVVLDAEFAGETVDAYGATRSGFSAHTTINRNDFGVTIDLAWGAGNKVVGDKVEIALELEFTKNA